MRKIIILVLLVLGAMMLYRAFTGGLRGSGKGKKPSPKHVVRDAAEQGRRMGRGGSKAFDSVDFGGKK